MKNFFLWIISKILTILSFLFLLSASIIKHFKLSTTVNLKIPISETSLLLSLSAGLIFPSFPVSHDHFDGHDVFQLSNGIMKTVSTVDVFCLNHPVLLQHIFLLCCLLILKFFLLHSELVLPKTQHSIFQTVFLFFLIFANVSASLFSYPVVFHNLLYRH